MVEKEKKKLAKTIDITAEEVANEMVADPHITAEEAARKLGWGFAELTKAQRSDILKVFNDLYGKAGGIPDNLRAEMVKTTRNMALFQALANGDLRTAREVGLEIASEPGVGLTKANNEVVIDLTGLESLMEKKPEDIFIPEENKKGN